MPDKQLTPNMRRALNRLARYERRPVAMQSPAEISAILTEECTPAEQRALARRNLPEYRAALARMRAVDLDTLSEGDRIDLVLKRQRVAAMLAELERLVTETEP
jgi:hypothetical protein